MPIDHIGRYKIEAELGKGAMGVVYKATDPNIGRTVALKTMRVDVHGIESEEMVKRFHAEARNAGVLNHTNIVTIYDAQELEGTFYIAMEYIQGQTLQELLKVGTAPVEKVIDITRQVCAGLDYAAARGIVHRDVKPANIMIMPDGTVKIMDFGIAKSAGTGMTSTGQVLGTPNYMSPEQVKGRTLDGRSDLFSMGVVLYEMLTGERPFTGDNVTTIIYKIVNEQPPTPRDLDSTVHAGLSAIVMKALAKNRDERYQKGVDLASDLLHYNKVGPEAAQQTSVLSEQAIPQVVHPPVATAGGAAAAMKAAPQLQSTVNVHKKAAPADKAAVPAASMKGPLVLGGALLAVVLAVAGYVGIKLKSKPAEPTPVPAAQVAQPSQPATPSEAVPYAVTPSKAKATPKAAIAKPEAVVPTGDLRITSTPAGAAINVDGKDQPQQTPATIKLSQGQHAVVVSMDGYKPETRHPEITVGQRTNMTAVLTATVGFMMVSSDPPGAEILVDGNATGAVTPAKVKASPGQHTFTVRKQGYKEQASSAFVLVGQTLPLSSFSLPATGQTQSTKKGPRSENVPPSNVPAGTTAQQPAPQKESGNPFRKLGKLFGSKEDAGKLEIRTNPKGAEILVNGNPTGKKTPVKTDSPVGSYTITLQMDGYKPVTRKIQITKGQTTGIEETLEKQ
jgi:predicted Ser/Thr protein kinase